MKIGDRVEVVAVPESLPSGRGTQALFEACVGRVFPVVGIENGLLELEVGEAVGEESFMHSIWIEPECVVCIVRLGEVHARGRLSCRLV